MVVEGRKFGETCRFSAGGSCGCLFGFKQYPHAEAELGRGSQSCAGGGSI